MKKSDTIKEIAAALAKAQGKFPVITKNKTAKIPMKSGGEYKYNYADLGDVLKACIPILSENGLALIQPLDITADGKLILETHLIHSSGEWFLGTYPLPLLDRAQDMGSEITYGRRYNACTMIGVVAEDDDDGKAASDAAGKKEPAGKIPKPKEQGPIYNGNSKGLPVPKGDVIASSGKPSSLPKPKEDPKAPVKDEKKESLKRLMDVAGNAGWTNHDVTYVIQEQFKAGSSKDLTFKQIVTLTEIVKNNPPPEKEGEFWKDKQ